MASRRPTPRLTLCVRPVERSCHPHTMTVDGNFYARSLVRLSELQKIGSTAIAALDASIWIHQLARSFSCSSLWRGFHNDSAKATKGIDRGERLAQSARRRPRRQGVPLGVVANPSAPVHCGKPFFLGPTLIDLGSWECSPGCILGIPTRTDCTCRCL